MTSTAPQEGMVSVLLITYNHGSYIEQALTSLYAQDYQGPMELIVADDCSTDNTVELIRNYISGNARFSVRFLQNDVNLGITRNYERGFAACTGKYVAVLEGDDYWTSPAKITRQARFLDEHLECDLCAVNYFVFEEARAFFYPRLEPAAGHRLLQSRDLIDDNIIGNFSTCMYRASALQRLPRAIFALRAYDWIVNISVGRNALLGFLLDPMSVYRLHAKGTWTQMTAAHKLRQQIEVLSLYDDVTDGVFSEEFKRLEHRLEQALAACDLGSATVEAQPPAIVARSRLVQMVPLPIYKILRAILPGPVRRLIAKILLR